MSVQKDPKIKIADVSVHPAGVLDIIDTFDRPGDAFSVGTYSGSGTYAEGFEDKPGKRIPKAGAYASTGVGLARAEWSIFEAEARGPNATAGAGASAVSGAGAFARAELASASASAGPFVAKLGLAADTGIQVGPAGLEAKILGTGFTFGPRPSVSLLGSELECVIC